MSVRISPATRSLRLWGAVVALWLVPAGAHGDAPWTWLLGVETPDPFDAADRSQRLEAARVLGRFGPTRHATDRLAEAFVAERDPEVRRAMIESLGRRASGSSADLLAAAFRERQPELQLELAFALAAIASDGAVQALVEGLGRQDTSHAAHTALLRVGPNALRHLVVALREPATRVAAIATLGELGDRRATPWLLPFLRAEELDVRWAVARALGALEDPRAADPLLESLGDDEHPGLFASGLEALGSTGTARHAPRVLAALEDERPRVRRAALRALAKLDLLGAFRYMTEAAVRGDPVLGPVSVELALETRRPEVVPFLYGLVQEGSRAEDALSALAEVEDGAGLSVLLAVARGEGAVASSAQRSMAVALRQWGAVADGGLVGAARALLRSMPVSARALLLRALARDSEAAGELLHRLRSDDSRERAWAAWALELLGDTAHAAPLRVALAVERDPEAWRRICAALVRLGDQEDVPLVHLFRPMAGSAAAPEAMALAALQWRRTPAGQRRRLGRLFRQGLRDVDPRVRAGAARALGLALVRDASRALLVALEDEEVEVRRAAADALGHLGVAGTRRVIRGRAHIEPDPTTRTALLDALQPGRRPAPPRGLSGRQVLRLRVGGRGAGPVTVDVVCTDGRWMRLRTLPTGELILADLPHGIVDVRLRVEDGA